MSLFSDIVNSIGSEKSPAPPKPPARPLSANALRSALDVSKPGLRPSVPAAPSPLNGTKRKAEDTSSHPPEKLIKPNPTPATNNKVTHRPAAPPLNAPKPTNKHLTVPKPKLDATSIPPPKPNSAPTTPTSATAKVPSKGSYAELMARAKQAQTDKAQQTQVGVIKHQATHREKVSKVAERKRQEEEKAKAGKDKTTNGRPALGRQQIKSRSSSPAKKTDQAKVPRAPRPPLHAPQTSSYKGTMGTAPGRAGKPPPKARRKYDEYLGTDEEEDSDDMGGYGEDEEEGYGSDASSDMEAGLDDLDQEEQRALRYAKEEDAREQALENKLKREKDEKRKKLEALAKKRA